MDLSKLSTSDKVIGGSGIVLLISSFLPWFSFSLLGESFSQNGWDYFFTGIIPVLLGLVMVAWIVGTKLAEVDLPELPVPEGLMLLAMGGTAALLIVLRLLIGAGDDPNDVLDRGFGLFLSVLAAIGLAAGAFLKFQEDGGELPGAGGSAGGASGTPPTPF
jgi:hypothetical protein